MNTLAPSRPWARLGALACATILATSLAASVAVQPQSRAAACPAEATLEARLNATILRAIEQAHVDQDFELVESLERLLAARAAAR